MRTQDGPKILDPYLMSVEDDMMQEVESQCAVRNHLITRSHAGTERTGDLP